MDSIVNRLANLGLKLPEVSSPGGNYQSVVKRSNLVFVAIQFPILNGNFLYQGRFGREFNTDDGYKALQLCALNVIAQVHSKIGFEYILGLNHIDIYYRSNGDWDESPKAANGASDLFVNVLDDKGMHSRAIVGVENLPREFCAGITANFTLI